MIDTVRLDPVNGLEVLLSRLGEPAPGRLQLIAGPRQVGKTHLLLQAADALGARATYAACDGPEAVLPGWWEQLWQRAEAESVSGSHVLLLDEVHVLPQWSARLKGQWDRVRRKRVPLHVLATGSSALHLGRGSRETLAGRFERMVYPHWSVRSLATVFGMNGPDAARHSLRWGTYPGVLGVGDDPVRRAAYIRDAIVEPAIGRDLLSSHDIRRPGLLRQVFAAAAASPAQIVSLQKLQGQLHDAGALETIAHYLRLLEDAFLVAALEKYSARALRQRSAPPKLVVLSHAMLSAFGSAGTGELGPLVENACLAHAWNSGQQVRYWREEPLEVDAVLNGSWGAWAMEVKTGEVGLRDLSPLLAFAQRFPTYRPLLVCSSAMRDVGLRAGVHSVSWEEFLTDSWLPK